MSDTPIITPEQHEEILRAVQPRLSYAEQRAQQREAMREVAGEICGALTDYGIEAIWAEFNGSGDSGDVAEVALQRTAPTMMYQRGEDGHARFDLPQVPMLDDKGEPVMQLENVYVGEEYQPQPVIQANEFPLPDELQGTPLPDFTKEMEKALCDKMETLTFMVLSQERGGWENNDGAFGSMTLHANGRLVCDYNERVTETLDNSFELENPFQMEQVS
jgi:hypothetical protein